MTALVKQIEPLDVTIKSLLGDAGLTIFIEDSHKNMHTWVASYSGNVNMSVALCIKSDICMVIIKPVIKISDQLYKGPSRSFNGSVDNVLGWLRLNLSSIMCVAQCYDKLIMSFRTEFDNNHLGYVTQSLPIVSKDSKDNEYIKMEWTIITKVAFDSLNVKISAYLFNNTILCRRKIGNKGSWKRFSKSSDHSEILCNLKNEMDSIRGQIYPDPFVYDVLMYDKSYFGENIVLFPLKRVEFEEGNK